MLSMIRDIPSGSNVFQHIDTICDRVMKRQAVLSPPSFAHLRAMAEAAYGGELSLSNWAHLDQLLDKAEEFQRGKHDPPHHALSASARPDCM